MFPAAPSCRKYVHIRCGQPTQISGFEFERLCDPFDPATRTFCSSCGQMDDIQCFQWLDTTENLGAYRTRLRNSIPPAALAWRWVRLVIIIGLPLFAMMAAAVAGVSPSDKHMNQRALWGLGVGFVVALVVLIVVGRRLRIDFRRYR